MINWLLGFALLIVGLIKSEIGMIVDAGLFAIAGEISLAAYQFVKNKQ
jgi:uncharacterized membrane protein